MSSEPSSQTRPSGRVEGQRGLSPAPEDHANQPLWQCPLGQCCYLQRWGCQTTIVLSVQSGHVPSSGMGTLGKSDLHRLGLPTQRAMGSKAAHWGCTAMRVPVPCHRAGGVTCNPVEMQSPINVNSSSLKSLMKETGKGVACI